MKLAAILRHEMAHLEGADEAGARDVEARTFRELVRTAPYLLARVLNTPSSSTAVPRPLVNRRLESETGPQATQHPVGDQWRISGKCSDDTDS